MIRFSQINRPDRANHKPNYQRHHLIPRQAFSEVDLQEVLGDMEEIGFHFEDFEKNGILLPCCEKEALRTGRPLHRGPHPRYNEIVIERLARISSLGQRIDKFADRQNFYQFRFCLLLASLHTGLSHPRFKKIFLSRRDPLRSPLSFELIDARIEAMLYRAGPTKRKSVELR